MRLVETDGLWWAVKEPEAAYPLKVGAPGRGGQGQWGPGGRGCDCPPGGRLRVRDGFPP